MLPPQHLAETLVVQNIIVSAHMHAYVQIRSIDQPYTTLKLLNKYLQGDLLLTPVCIVNLLRFYVLVERQSRKH